MTGKKNFFWKNRRSGKKIANFKKNSVFFFFKFYKFFSFGFVPVIIVVRYIFYFLIIFFVVVFVNRGAVVAVVSCAI